MRLILGLVLTTCIVCVKSQRYIVDDGGKKLVRAYIGGDSSERQFINSVKNWIFGRGEEKQTAKTKIKYLPIYVPVPVYSSMKVPGGSEYYGAHQQNKDREEVMKMPQVPSTPSLPYPHNQNYELPYGGQVYQVSNRQRLPFYYAPYEEQLTKPAQEDYTNQYYSPVQSNGNGGYDYGYDDSYGSTLYEDQAPSDYDSVVINNPELTTDPEDSDEIRNGEDLLRKRKRYRKKKY